MENLDVKPLKRTDYYLKKYGDWTERADALHHGFVSRENEQVEWTPLTRPLSACTVALVTTGGVHHCDQEPFDDRALQGDPSSRVIKGDVATDDLVVTDSHYDHSAADRDINCLFPLDRIRELVAEGGIGATSVEHFGFMGFNPKPDRLLDKASEVTDRLTELNVDVAILTPG